MCRYATSQNSYTNIILVKASTDSSITALDYYSQNGTKVDGKFPTQDLLKTHENREYFILSPSFLFNLNWWKRYTVSLSLVLLLFALLLVMLSANRNGIGKNMNGFTLSHACIVSLNLISFCCKPTEFLWLKLQWCQIQSSINVLLTP